MTETLMLTCTTEYINQDISALLIYLFYLFYVK